MRTSRKLALFSGGFAFTYTGTYEFIKSGSDWKIKFLTDGDLTVNKDVTVDIFAVGGGGSSYKMNVFGTDRDSGGGGGYTSTVLAQTLYRGVTYYASIGAGGGINPYPENGGPSSFGDYNASDPMIIANGGKCPIDADHGGAGGSGGGGRGGSSAGATAGDGGSDGSNGTAGRGTAGQGQGTTTREFGEPGGDLYAGGGGGIAYGTEISIGQGGAGGGGDGGQAGTPNTGGGAGGRGGRGGSGIVIIRNAR